MIVLFRPPRFGQHHFSLYRHCWTLFGESRGQVVIELPLNEDSRCWAWDELPGCEDAFVIHVLPNFIPFPSFWDELDRMETLGIRAVVLKQDDWVFRPGQEAPTRLIDYHWTQAVFAGEKFKTSAKTCQPGISEALMCWMIRGRQSPRIPQSKRQDWRKWLRVRERGWLYQAPQNWLGTVKTPRLKSALGTLVPEFWAGKLTTFGRIITGCDRVFNSSAVLRGWLESLMGWEVWLRKSRFK